MSPVVSVDMPTISQPPSPISSMQRVRARVSRLMRSILAKVRIPSSSSEGPVLGRGELPLGNVATISKDEVDESPPASPYHNGSTPHRDSDTSLSSQAEGPSSTASVDLHPTRVRLPNAASVPQMSPESDVLTPILCHERPPSSPQGPVMGIDPSLCPSMSLTDREGIQLRRERRMGNLLDLERERTRIKLLDLEKERTKINLLGLERERTRINLLDQGFVGGLNVERAFARPETSNQLRSSGLFQSGYLAGGASAQIRHYPADVNRHSISEAWTTGFRSDWGTVA